MVKKILLYMLDNYLNLFSLVCIYVMTNIKKKMKKHVRNYTIIYLIYASIPLLFLLLFPFIACAWKTGILVVGLWIFMIWGFLQFAKSKDNK